MGDEDAELVVDEEEELAAFDRARERTTSPLQMGQVRRRVTSQGVLLRENVSRIALN